MLAREFGRKGRELVGREAVFKDRLPGALPLMLFTYLLHCCFSDFEIFSLHSSQCFIA